MVRRLTSLLVASAAVVAPSSASFLWPRYGDALTLDSKLATAGNGGEFTWYRRSTGDMKNASLNFDEAILTRSNLGNKRPDSGKPSLRFAKIWSQDGMVYDMVVMVANGSSYGGDTNKNLLDPQEDLGQINMYQQTLDLKLATMMVNNLGGDNSLVENAMAFQNALTIDGQGVDLKVEPVGEYKPGNAEQNGLRGEFAQINVPANATATFRFTFMVNGEGYPVKDLFSALYDIDAEANGGHEILTMLNGGGTFFLSDTTSILPDAADLSTPIFTTIEYGSIANNPTGADAADEELDHAASFYFHRATQSFDITFATPGVKAPRNFALGGNTVACGR